MNKKDMDIPVWSGLETHLHGISAVICDLWGVLHDGMTVHVEAAECLKKIRSLGIPVALLSNSPKPIDDVWAHLGMLGLPRSIADGLTTSGSLARSIIRRKYAGMKMYHLGPSERDEATLLGLPVALMTSPDEADFILCTGLNHTTGEAHASMLKVAALDKKPMICANPDRIVHVRGELHLCAGIVADVYEQLGGPVEWAGKPSASAYHAAMQTINMPIDTQSVLMIGDSLNTDIAGAVDVGYEGVLIANGIHRDDIVPMLHQDNVTYRALAQTLDRDISQVPLIKAIMPNLIW